MFFTSLHMCYIVGNEIILNFKCHIFLPETKFLMIIKKFLDQYQYLGNCPPTPPLTQQQSIDNKSGLNVGLREG